jgi:hypothetical protein
MYEMTPEEFDNLSDGSWKYRIEELENRLILIEDWRKTGELIFQNVPSLVMFHVGYWWADRPWRKR